MSATPSRAPSQWQSLALVAVAALIIIAIYALVAVPQMRASITNSQASAIAKQLARAQDNQISQFVVQLDGLARSPQLRQALEVGDEVMLERLSTQWRVMLASADSLRFFPLAELGVDGLSDTMRSKLRNNIEKNMLRSAEKSTKAVIDLFQLNGSYKFCAAKLVTSGNRNVGVILLCLNDDWLAAQIDEFNSESNIGSAALLSRIGGGNGSVVVGNALPSASFAAESELRTQPGLYIVYALANALPVSALSLIVVAAGFLIVLIIASVAMRRYASAIHTAYTEDAEQLQRFVVESLGNETAAPELKFDSLANVLDKFQQAISKFREKHNKQAPTKAVSKPETAQSTPKTANLLKDVGANTGIADSEPMELPPTHIFRAYDIRGVAGEDLTASYARTIGQAFGSYAQREGNDQVVVGRDGRLSSEELSEALIEGLLQSGCDVIDVGLVPSPVLYFAVEHLTTGAGVMVTGSHNSPEYNGFKMVVNGEALVDEAISGLHNIIADDGLAEGAGGLSTQEVSDAYIDQIVDDVVFASPIKVVLDCGNGAASEIAPLLYASMGAEVVPLFADIDGNFPNHLPDPGVAENLSALVAEVAEQQADIGLAFDGDADRVVAVTGDGQIVEADQLLMLFAKDVLTRNPGADVVYDQKCTRELSQLIANHGGRPVAWKSGHSRIKQKMREIGALLGGEYSGHFFFKERWFGFDDGLYSGARLIEMLTLEGLSLADSVASLPQSISTPELTVSVDEASKFDLIDALAQSSAFEGGEVSTLDGVRVDFDNGWGLVRASNTSAKLTMRFEADSDADLEQLKGIFADALKPLGIEI